MRLTSSGSFKNTERFLKRMQKGDIFGALESQGRVGVDALARETPKDSSTTANSWRYEVSKNGEIYAIHWYNDNVVDGVKIAIILQYGHATGTGGYVNGIDYINPALRPIFDKISADVWKVVMSA